MAFLSTLVTIVVIVLAPVVAGSSLASTIIVIILIPSLTGNSSFLDSSISALSGNQPQNQQQTTGTGNVQPSADSAPDSSGETIPNPSSEPVSDSTGVAKGLGGGTGIGKAGDFSAPTQEEQYVINAINDLRRKNNLQPLNVSPILQKYVQRRLQYSLERGYCDTWHQDKEIFFPGGYNEVVVGPNNTLSSIVPMWRDSPGHRAVILDQNYPHKYIGVAVGHVPANNSLYCAYAVLPADEPWLPSLPALQ